MRGTDSTKTLNVLCPLLCAVLALMVASGCRGVVRPNQIGVDASGRILVYNQDGFTSFDANGRAVTSKIPVENVGPEGFAVAPDGLIYVPYSDFLFRPYGLAIFSHDSGGKVSRVGSAFKGPDEYGGGGFAVAGSGIIVIARQGSLEEYSARLGEQRPLRIISGKATGLTVPVVLASRSDGQICAGNQPGEGAVSIVCFAPSASGDATPIRRIAGYRTRLTRYINGLAIAPDGTLVVACISPDELVVFSPDQTGDVVPAAVISGARTGLDNPDEVAIDSRGNIYSANARSPGSVTVYPKGAHGDVPPLRAIARPSVPFGDTPSALALGPDRTLFVGIGSHIFLYDTQKLDTGSSTTSFEANCANFIDMCRMDLATDSSGRLFALTCRVQIFSRSASDRYQSSGQFGIPGGTYGYPHFVVADPLSRVFLVDGCGDIWSYPDNGLGHTRARYRGYFSHASSNISAMAATADGTIYFSQREPSVVYELPGGKGRYPIELAGPRTRLARPEGLAVDRAGNLFVANYASNELTEFDAGSSGNVAPKRIISGSSTLLDHPTGVAVGADGRIYVVNGAVEFPVLPGMAWRTATVTIYAASSDGNVAPLSILKFQQTFTSDSL